MPNDKIFNYEPLWGEWRIKEQIGQGSIGKVYSIYKTVLDVEQISAVKFMTIPTKDQVDLFNYTNDTINKKSETDFYYNIVQEIGKEINLLYNLKGHSNIISYEDCSIHKVENENTWHILIKMEYATSLKDFLKNNKLDESEIIKIGIDISKALIKCHENNIIHRDIKEANIFRSQDGIYKLGDFSVSRNTSSMTVVNTKVGTLDCMPPEVFNGKPYNFRADIYSLGIMLYKLSNYNRLPFLPEFPEIFSLADIEKSQSFRMSGRQFNLPQNASQSFAEIILKACAFDPNERFQSAKELKDALNSLKSDTPSFDLTSTFRFDTLNQQTNTTIEDKSNYNITKNLTSNDTLNNFATSNNISNNNFKSNGNTNTPQNNISNKNSIIFKIALITIILLSVLYIVKLNTPAPKDPTTKSTPITIEASKDKLSTDVSNIISETSNTSSITTNEGKTNLSTPIVLNASSKAITNTTNIPTSLNTPTTSVASLSKTPGPCQIIVYEHSNFEGKYLVLDATEYPNLDSLSFNDTISSIKLGSNVTATIYTDLNYGGESETITSSTKLTDNKVKNDTITSIKINATPGANQIIVFEHELYGGRCLLLNIGEYPDLTTYGYNDFITSIKVGSSVMATVYTDWKFGGTSYNITKNNSNVSNTSVGNDTISSIKVTKSSQ